MPEVNRDERALEPGEIVTVTAALAAEMGEHLYVVIDGFDDPRYTLALLGGDGYQWPNVARQDIIPVAPQRIVRVSTGGDTAAYAPA
ncbi:MULTISPECIES: hypothetical protein [unclassified Micromonospora]|uniref:hypothetical protein n=1 Tax=unclassified Micromonospora TaxID=2617518 RepID=UPI001C2339CA|nr:MULTISPECIES: hypothetical protein [unclassified Micromonospora]MBU8857757.1 hypothetical protein [Micromonospora sp. WMMB482]MDM4783384.1 hypothetical protein [Micromonospora sp. b486]